MTRTIDQLLDQARARLRRLDPHQAAAVINDGGLLIDIRPAAQRQEEGEIPGAIIVERNVLEWRLDPTSRHRLAQVRGHDQPIVILCSEGLHLQPGRRRAPGPGPAPGHRSDRRVQGLGPGRATRPDSRTRLSPPHQAP